MIFVSLFYYSLFVLGGIALFLIGYYAGEEYLKYRKENRTLEVRLGFCKIEDLEKND